MSVLPDWHFEEHVSLLCLLTPLLLFQINTVEHGYNVMNGTEYFVSL
jgi:hypothetical protein